MPEKKSKNRKGLDPTVWVAIVTLIGTISVALLSYEPIEAWWNTRLNATATISPPAIEAVESPTLLPSETPTEILTIEPSLIFTETSTPLPTDTPTATQIATIGEMNAQLVYNYVSRKPPLTVTFNAHSSYLSHSDGTVQDCLFKNVCSYTWDVRQGSTPIYGPEASGGVFSYTFQKKRRLYSSRLCLPRWDM